MMQLLVLGFVGFTMATNWGRSYDYGNDYYGNHYYGGQPSYSNYGGGGWAHPEPQYYGQQVPKGKCCFCPEYNCDVINYPHYKRVTAKSGEECAGICCSQEHYCKGAVFDEKKSHCDLFERSAGIKPSTLVYKTYRTWYGYDPHCKCPNAVIVGPSEGSKGEETTAGTTAAGDTTAAETTAASVDTTAVTTGPTTGCPDGQELFWIRAEDTLINAQPTAVQDGIANEEACQQACIDDTTCNSAAFNEGTQQCALFTQSLSDNPPVVVDRLDGDANDAQGVDTLSKLCLDSNNPLVQSCTSREVFLGPQRLLIGFVFEEAQAGSLEECIAICATNPQCTSANYFADQNTDNCLLKDETRTTRGDVYIDAGEQDGDVIYLEPCNTGAAAMSFNAMFAAVARNRDLPLAGEPWGAWGACQSTEGGHIRVQLRSRKCRENIGGTCSEVRRC